jgi:hypothetical protein
MARDFTDYIAFMMGAEKRTFHIIHFVAKKDEQPASIFTHSEWKPGTPIEFNYDRDRAYRLRWHPWDKVNKKDPLWTINELARSKKVGILLYHEPHPQDPFYREVKTKAAKEYVCTECEFKTVHLQGIKTHLRRLHKTKDYGKHIRVGFETKTERVPYYPVIEPLHLSRMHQPSGELKE